jgi:hypothetical protein
MNDDNISQLVDEIINGIKGQSIVSSIEMVDALLDIRNAAVSMEQELQQLLDANKPQTCGCPE